MSIAGYESKSLSLLFLEFGLVGRDRWIVGLAGTKLIDASHADDLRQNTPSPPPIATIFEVINDRARGVEFDGAGLA